MNIKYAHVYLALAKLRDEMGDEALKSAVLDISVTEDDPGSGRMIECLTIKCSKSQKPRDFDNIKNPTIWDFTLELFANSENRPPRMSLTGVRDLERKEE